MAFWILDQWSNGELDYPTLGFRAQPNDILSAAAAPDSRWSSTASGPETVERYTVGSDPSYVEPTDGHVLAWSDSGNAYVATSLAATTGAMAEARDTGLAADINDSTSATRTALNSLIASSTPVSYAAAPTGTTPVDAAAVTAAIDALPASGGRVILDAGTYVGRFAIAKANVTLVGQGQGVTTLQLPADAGVAQTLTITADGVTVNDLTVDGNAPAIDPGNTRECDGISIYASDVTIERCHIKNTMAHGIIVWNEATSGHNGAPNATAAAGARYRHRILSNKLENTGTTYEARSAIDIATSVDNTMSVVAFNSIIGGDGTSSAITMHSGSKCLILGNLIEMPNCERAMMVHTGANLVQVIGNIVRPKVGATTGPQYMCNLTNANDVLFSGNTFQHGAGVGAMVNLDQTITGLSLVDNIHKNTSASETDVALVKCQAAAVLTAVTARGNRTHNHTSIVSGTAAQKSSVAVADHYSDNVLAVADRNHYGWKSGNYYGAANVAVGATRSLSNGQAWAFPIVVPRPVTIDRIGVEVTTAGDAAATVRLGLYGPGADGEPGALIVDAGTVAAATTGFKEATVSQFLNPGIYYAAVVGQGAATAPVVRAATGVSLGIGSTSGASATQANTTSFHTAAGAVTAALPAALTLSGTASAAPYPVLRVA